MADYRLLMKTIYLAHALTGASKEFVDRMLALRNEINQLGGVQVLEFNWKPGKGPDKAINTYAHDMAQVRRADLMVAILDYPSTGLGMEILMRCQREDPILLFHQLGSPVSKMATDCIRWYRRDPVVGSEHLSELHDPVIYYGNDEIVDAVNKWLRAHLEHVSRPLADDLIG